VHVTRIELAVRALPEEKPLHTHLAGRPDDQVGVGDVARFATAEKLASYAGTTPRVHASGGKTRFGPSRPDVNRYLKWAFVEAAKRDLFDTRARGASPRQPAV
jgi:transposase